MNKVVQRTQYEIQACADRHQLVRVSSDTRVPTETRDGNKRRRINVVVYGYR